MAIKCNPSDFTAVVAAQLHDYTMETLEKISAETVNCGKDCVDELQKTSPKRRGKGGGKYAKGWRIKSERSSGGLVTTCVVHNATHYQLTHLLENGHATRDGGRTKSYPHIKPAEERVVAEYVRRTKEAIQK